MLLLFADRFFAGGTRRFADYFNFILIAGLCPGGVVGAEKGNNLTAQSYGYVARTRIVCYYKVRDGEKGL